MLAIPHRAIDHWKLEPSRALVAETARHPHHVGVVQGLAGVRQRPPPQPEAAAVNWPTRK